MSTLPEHAHHTDEDLARQVAAGDDEAFAELYRRHSARLLRTGRRVLGTSEEADDALQGAAVKALGALRRATPRGAVRPWLERIVHNEAIDLLRARRPWGELDAEGAEAATSSSPERVVLGREALAALADDLRALPERQRVALLLRQGAGRSYGELAELMGTSQLAARQAVAQAQAALREDAAARDADCAGIRAVLLDPDRRRHRGRQVRTHLRTCRGCRDFQHVAVPPRRLLVLPHSLLAALGTQSPAWLTALSPGGVASTSSAGAGRAVGAALAVAVAVAVPAPQIARDVRHTGDGAARPRTSRPSTTTPASASPSEAGTSSAARAPTRATAGDEATATAPVRSTTPSTRSGQVPDAARVEPVVRAAPVRRGRGTTSEGARPRAVATERADEEPGRRPGTVPTAPAGRSRVGPPADPDGTEPAASVRADRRAEAAAAMPTGEVPTATSAREAPAADGPTGRDRPVADAQPTAPPQRPED